MPPRFCSRKSTSGVRDIAARGDGHDHVFAFDQVLVIHIAGPFDDFGAARYGELVFDLDQLVRDDFHDPLAGPQDGEVILDLDGQVFKFVGDFLDTQLGQALQAQFQNGASLGFGQVVGAVVIHRVAGIIDQQDEGGDFLGGPAAFHQFDARLGGILAGADRGDDFVDIADRDGQTAKHMAALTRFAQFKRGAACNNFLAEGDEIAEKIA